MKNTLSPQELAQEALEALRTSPMTSQEHFEFLVQQGIIDRSGRVLVAKLFGEQADQNGAPSSQAASNEGKNGTQLK